MAELEGKLKEYVFDNYLSQAVHQRLKNQYDRIIAENSKIPLAELEGKLKEYVFDNYSFPFNEFDTINSVLHYGDVSFPSKKEKDDKKFITELPETLEKKELEYLVNQFENTHDDEIYAICGPVYFDYNWIFRQPPQLIKHILGEMSEKELKELKGKGWVSVEDPLTENKYYINTEPEERSYPKMRFDNPTKLNDVVSDFRYKQQHLEWKEIYISPAIAKSNLSSEIVRKIHKQLEINTTLGIPFDDEDEDAPHSFDIQPRRMRSSGGDPDLDKAKIRWHWTTPGYYLYQYTPNPKDRERDPKKPKKPYSTLLRPKSSSGFQDYTEPNLPTAYPPPLMNIVPPFRGPKNTFMIHTFIPEDTFIENGRLKTVAFTNYIYKMMQLIFKTADKNSTPITTKKRICIKLLAIGYNDNSFKKIRSEDTQNIGEKIGDIFFSAVRDFSMMYESTIHVILYYDLKTQQNVKLRYDNYVNQRLSILNKSNVALDSTLHFKISDMEDFFTLKWTLEDSLNGNDLLYFVDYCSTSRAFIGNTGKIPENLHAFDTTAYIDQIVNCLNNIQGDIDDIYLALNIEDIIAEISKNIENWRSEPKPQYYATILKKYENMKEVIEAADAARAADERAAAAIAAAGTPEDRLERVSELNAVEISWWRRDDGYQPRNAYISSFEEHIYRLKNLLDQVHAVAPAARAAAPPPLPGVGASPHFEIVKLYTECKTILKILIKMKYDDIQISKAHHNLIKQSLTKLELPFSCSWSMDAKFTTGVDDGANLPNSSVLHNPFFCTKILDPKEWQFIDFEDIGVHDIPKSNPVSQLVKPFVDAKIRSSENATPVKTNTLIVSKNPNMEMMSANIQEILTHIMYKNARVKYNGNSMILINYSWDKQIFVKKRNDKSRVTQSKTIDFAELMGLRSQKGCVNYPIFIANLSLYLYKGNLSDITSTDLARISCDLDGAMFKTNMQIVWDQMMRNLNEIDFSEIKNEIRKQFETQKTEVELKSVPRPPGPPPPPPPPPPPRPPTYDEIFRNITSNTEVLKRLVDNTPGRIIDRSITHARDAAVQYNTDVIGMVSNPPPSNPPANKLLGWNTYNQYDCDTLYITVDGNEKTPYTSLKPGDEIWIKNVNITPVTIQKWNITGVPTINGSVASIYVEKVIAAKVKFKEIGYDAQIKLVLKISRDFDDYNKNVSVKSKSNFQHDKYLMLNTRVPGLHPPQRLREIWRDDDDD
ncbi:MAG: hypothetical protein FJX80_07815, partial [Bacteroidetes bacterium]|nr:hypothetical protein [Bacteroidota bacterium]